MIKTPIFYSLSVALLFATSVASANEPADAADSGVTFEEKLAACGACHGENGDKPLLPEYPVLAGQFESYLANALRQYRDGQRSNEIMALQLEILELTDDDIDGLASYFASQKSRLHGLAD